MTNDKRDRLTVLKKELEFLEQGGYRETARVPWRPQFIFQDSPTCLNFDLKTQAKPCADCMLIEFVPEALRARKVPCRYIPLNEKGETIDSFYRFGTQAELEDSFGRWLRATIERLEKQPAGTGRAAAAVEIHVKAKAYRTEWGDRSNK